ncbi:MAG: hypothetical protein R3E96_16905 [Planctomycetota bacterium]
MPTAEQTRERERLAGAITAAEAALLEMEPAEVEAWQAFQRDLPATVGLAWQPSTVVAAHADKGTTLTVTAAGTVLASGENPATEVQHVVLETQATDLRLLEIDALGHPDLPLGRPGRAANGNAVLTAVHARAVSIVDPTRTRELEWTWLWADHAQGNEGLPRTAPAARAVEGLGHRRAPQGRGARIVVAGG